MFIKSKIAVSLSLAISLTTFSVNATELICNNEYDETSQRLTINRAVIYDGADVDAVASITMVGNFDEGFDLESFTDLTEIPVDQAKSLSALEKVTLRVRSEQEHAVSNLEGDGTLKLSCLSENGHDIFEKSAIIYNESSEKYFLEKFVLDTPEIKIASKSSETWIHLRAQEDSAPKGLHLLLNTFSYNTYSSMKAGNSYLLWHRLVPGDHVKNLIIDTKNSRKGNYHVKYKLTLEKKSLWRWKKVHEYKTILADYRFDLYTPDRSLDPSSWEFFTPSRFSFGSIELRWKIEVYQHWHAISLSIREQHPDLKYVRVTTRPFKVNITR